MKRLFFLILALILITPSAPAADFTGNITPASATTRQAANLSGKVTYSSTGAPVAGINLVARSNDSPPTFTITGPDGAYTFKNLAPGQYIVALRSNPDLEKSWTAVATDSIGIAAADEKTGINLSLIPGVTITGSVIAADDGSPVANVPIGIFGPAHPRAGRSSQSVSTDSTGHFSARVPPGEQLVYIMSDTPADGFGRPSPDNKIITIADGGPSPAIEFRLPRVLMSPVKGKVVDADGNPVAGAIVFAFSEQSPMFQRTPVITTADGTFSSMPLLRTGKIDIRARYHDQATPQAIVIIRAAPDLVIHLQKNGLASITGRVIDPGGQPLKGAHIELIIQSPRYSDGDTLSPADDQGNFKVDALWPDANYIIQASFDGYGTTVSPMLHLQAGQSLIIHDLTLYKRDSTVAGLLLDAASRPVVGQQVYVNGPRTGYNSLTTDSAGRFNCTVVSGDRLTVFYRTGRGFSRQSARAGDQNIILHTAPVRRPPLVPTHGPEAAEGDTSPSTPLAFNPADAVTWNAWLYAAILIVIGGAITVVANAIAAIRKSNSGYEKGTSAILEK